MTSNDERILAEMDTLAEVTDHSELTEETMAELSSGKGDDEDE